VVGCGVGLWAAAYFLFGLIDEKALLARCFNLALATLILLLLVSLELERSALLPLLDRIFRQKALPASRQQPLSPIGMFQQAWVGVPVALACIGRATAGCVRT
jgi:hypothetical protein